MDVLWLLLICGVGVCCLLWFVELIGWRLCFVVVIMVERVVSGAFDVLV